MNRTYFFIPASNRSKLQKSKQIGASQIIGDLEDAVLKSDYTDAVNNLLEDWVHIDIVRVDLEKLGTSSQEKSLFSKYKKVLFPKVSNQEDLEKMLLIADTYALKIYLLVEHPWSLLNLNSILQKYAESMIIGVCFGSHDFAQFMNVEKDSTIIYHARMSVALAAKAYGIESIDIASMELSNYDTFANECKQGFELGFDSKFIIHPKQLEWFNNINFYSQKDITWAKKIIKETVKGDAAVYVVDGQVIERPHIEKAKKIIEYFEKK